MIQVKTFYAYNELRNFSYLIFNDQSGEAWAIDPWDGMPFEEYIKTNSLALKGILNTHQHFDHIRGNNALKEAFNCPVKKMLNADVLKLDSDIELEILDTPGHTMDHQVFILKNSKEPFALFSGDTLFNAGVGHCRSGGNVDLLFETTQKLIKTLPSKTKLYPGHDYIQRNLEFAQTLEPENLSIKDWLYKVKEQPVEERGQGTLRDELSFNPFLRLSSAELGEKLLPDSKRLENKDQIERNLFRKIRSLRDNW